MISALSRLENGNLELTITIQWEQVKSDYDRALEGLTKKAEIKGFRKGKAPKKLVETKVNKATIFEEALKTLLPRVYLEAVKENQLKPILNPQVKVLSMEEGKDWQIKATTCEIPQIKLGDYKGEVTKALAADKIWVPGKDKKQKPPEKSQEDKMAKIFKTLTESCQFRIPEILIEDEVNRMLSRLIDQTAKLGLTVEQYLVSVGKTVDKIKEEYRRQAEELLRLEFILLMIADEQKIEISDAEVEKMIKAIPDEQSKKTFENLEQKAYLRQLLRKRKVIDNLASL